jgi:hypothetical protein
MLLTNGNTGLTVASVSSWATALQSRSQQAAGFKTHDWSLPGASTPYYPVFPAFPHQNNVSNETQHQQ